MTSGCGAPTQTLDLTGVDVASQTIIQGTVTRANAPVAGAFVRLLDATDEFTAEVVTSDEGAFRFFAAPGEWTVRVLAPGTTGQRVVSAVTGELTEADVVLA